MNFRRGLVLAGLVAWACLAVAWAAGVDAEWLAYALVALTLLLALEAVIVVTRRVRARWTGRNGDA
ncbi:MAG: hypothetical protein QNJ16_09520 [Rhodobacter sp.]|nr:hypothetical protein [Rhodobacter sp.]